MSDSGFQLRGRMVRDTIGSLLVKVAATGLTVLLAGILGRLLGSEGYGAYAFGISWVTLLSFAAVMGLDVLAIREISEARIKHEWGVLQGFLSWSRCIVALAGGALSACMAVGLWIFQGGLAPSTRAVLWMAVPILPVLALLRIHLGAVQGFGRVVQAQVPQMVLLPLCLLILMSLLWVTHHLNAQWAIGAYGLASLLALAVEIWLLARAARLIPPAASVRRPRQWLYSARAFLFTGFAAVFNGQIGVILLGTLKDPRAVGIFDVATKASSLVVFVLMAVNMPLGPVVTELYAKGDHTLLQRLVTKSARTSLFGALPVALGLIIFGHWLLGLVGNDFVEGAVPLSILCLGQIINAGAGSVGLILNMTGHERDAAKGIVMAAAINALLCFILIPIWGINGAAVAAALSTIIWNILLGVWVYQRIKVNPTCITIRFLNEKSNYQT